MCEWLSYGEWCDVKLYCGGRAFSAHRVVLASVSTFLRRLLLACPIDESPTLIFLPEFDLEAMSSVLYYIYNGEVIIQKQKLDLFLDIIRAMQIFIDRQYLPKTADKDYSNLSLDINYEMYITKNDIFTLGLEEDQRYIHLKKGNEIKNVLTPTSLGQSEFKNYLIRVQNPSDERKSTSLDNLKLPYADRQRNSFLRDLFIETYPQNGDVNGITAGVLAISNECYRAPASVLLTNANGNNPNVNEILLNTYEKTSGHTSDSRTVFNLHKQTRCNQNEHDYGESSKSFYDLSCKNFNRPEKINHKSLFEAAMAHEQNNHWSLMSTSGRLNLGFKEQVLSGSHVSPIDYGVSSSFSDTVKAKRVCRSDLNSTILSNNANRERYKERSSKSTILNGVLDSPWSPRIPQSFKPFRRKPEDDQQLQVTVKNMSENNIVNDSNNNIDRTQISANLIGADLVNVPSQPTTNTAALQTNLDMLSFKCSICSQVFLTRDLLLAHMRRHSTNARYTCGECGKTFSQLRNFKYHMSIHRGTREFAATCTVCGKYFNDRGYLSSHMKIHRNRKEYKCTLCPKSFNQRVAYNMHVRIHTGVKPHVCEQCGKAFSRKMLLKQHQRTHSGERPYACSHCDKRFADRSNMTLHLRLHTGIKPFSCTLCPKSFTKKHHLKSHLNFHTGSKPYSCPRCSLAFTQSSNMRTHLKKCRAPEPDAAGQ